MAEDPALARSLGIGRPDLARGYDDGGLVDLNTASAPVIAQVCGLDAALAEAIVAAGLAHRAPASQPTEPERELVAA